MDTKEESMTKNIVLAGILIFVIAASLYASYFLIPSALMTASHSEKIGIRNPGLEQEKKNQNKDFSTEGIQYVSLPIFKKPIFPCSDCHDAEEDNPKPRILKEEHKEIQLHHGNKDMWCLHCHDFKDRDKLHLANGKQIPFEKSERLCAQCHGKKAEEWRSGVHGKRIGYWKGPKTYWRCIYCHNPHKPNFGKLRSKPAPVHPKDIRWKFERR